MFTVTKNELGPALGLIRAGLLKSADLLPIHSHVLMQVKGGRLRLVSNCKVLHAETSLAVSGPDTALAIPGEISDIIDRLEGTIAFEPTDLAVTIKAGRTRLKLPCLGADSFPDLDAGVLEECGEVAVSDLARALHSVEIAVAKKDVRQYLTGALLEWKPGSLTLVGADGFMMAVARIATNSQTTGQCIVPLRTVVELMRMLRQRDGQVVKIAMNSQSIRFNLGNCVMTSRLLGGDYPHWQGILGAIPKAPDVNSVTVDRDSLVSALERVSLVARDKKELLLQYQEGRLILSTRNLCQSAEEPVKAEVTGAGEILVHKRQLVDTASRLSGVKIQLQIGGARQAIRVSGDRNTECYVLMPMLNDADTKV